MNCVRCQDPIDRESWEGWEVLVGSEVVGPCCNECSVREYRGARFERTVEALS